MKPYSGEALSSAQATLVSVGDGYAFLLGCAFRVHVAYFSCELLPCSLRAHDVFVHSGSPFDLIVSHLLSGVSIDLGIYKVSFDYIFEAQMGIANWALALSKLLYRMSFRMQPSSILQMWPSQRSQRCLKRECVQRRPAQDSTSAFVT